MSCASRCSQQLPETCLSLYVYKRAVFIEELETEVLLPHGEQYIEFNGLFPAALEAQSICAARSTNLAFAHHFGNQPHIGLERGLAELSK